MVENRVEYITLLLGLSKIGCEIALINTSLSDKSLLHCIKECNAAKLIIGYECISQVENIKDVLIESLIYNNDIKSFAPVIHVYNDLNRDIPNFDNHYISSLDKELQNFNYIFDESSLKLKSKSTDTLFYIFTSGTTGLPKAAKIRHARFLLSGVSFYYAHGLNSYDIFYTAMPLFHAAAGCIGLSVCWFGGLTLVLRRKFSARSFFEDCSLNRVTVIQYIGEICRYLVGTPPGTFDRAHCIAKAIGNGLSPGIWKKFQSRFEIPYIGEFYGSTEGNANLVNIFNRCGAIGYLSWGMQLIYPLQIIEFDHSIELPKRVNGRCIPSESGELIARLSPFYLPIMSFFKLTIKKLPTSSFLGNTTDPLTSFDGYTDPKSTADKILRDVFYEGDAWFRTGDLVRRDEGFIYFVDRIGDTYRWKGENVSAGEVATCLSGVPAEATVYGVSIENKDGRAGMAAIVLDSDNIDLPYFRASLKLPVFARPLFIRVLNQMDITSTFKHRKVYLERTNFNPSLTSDPLYFRDDRNNRYIEITSNVYQQIQSSSPIFKI